MRPPLFTKGYDLVIELYRSSEKFPKSQKFALAQQLQVTALQYLALTVQAVLQRHAQMGRQASLQLEQLRILVRLGHDMAWLSHRKYEELCNRMDELGRMQGGWLKAVGQKTLP